MSDSDDDLIPGIELTQWREGRVLTAEDIKMLSRFLKEVEEDERQMIDAIENADREVLMRLGGQTLVDACAAEDEAIVADAVQKGAENVLRPAGAQKSGLKLMLPKKGEKG